MTYRVTENINLPFKLMPVVHVYEGAKVEISLKVIALFERTIFASNIVIKVPAPPNATKCSTVVSSGKAKYEPEQQSIIWRIRRFAGNSEYTLRASINLIQTTNDAPWSKPPVSIDFQVPMFTASGLRVRFLRVIDRTNYKPLKWIRYMTKAGSYSHRI